MPDPGILIVAEMHGRAGREDELQQLLEELAVATREEPGCLAFRVFSDGEPREVTLLTAWLDQPAVQAHHASEHYRAYLARVSELLDRPSDVVVHHISASVHPRDQAFTQDTVIT